MKPEDVIESMLDELIKNIPETERNNVIEMKAMFDRFKLFHEQLNGGIKQTNLRNPSDSIKCVTSIGVLINAAILYVLNPFEKEPKSLGEMIAPISDINIRNKLLQGQHNKLSKIYQLCSTILREYSAVNDLAYTDKFNGDHKVFNEMIDQFILDITKYTQSTKEDDIKRDVCSLTIYIISAIRHSVYATYENSHLNYKSYYLLSELTEVLKEG